MSKELETVEMLTIMRGKDSITYLMSDWEKYGEDATPYVIRQNPSERTLFVKFNPGQADGFMKHQELMVIDPNHKEPKES